MISYISVCSGIEAATVAWHPLGWHPAGFAEIEKFPASVLAHHYPTVPNFGDMTQFTSWPNESIDLLVGGTPCQAFSVAGLRKGLDDPRGNLTLTFLALANKYRPRWVVWENVPGVLSDRTNAFGQFLAGLGQLGYGWAYRVLDAQYFGVAQRRRRVFVVANLGDWRRAAAVLFERESLRGDSPPSRKTREKPAGTLTSSLGRRGGTPNDDECQNLVTSGNNPMPRNIFPVTTLAIRGRNGEPSLELRDDGTANAVLTPNGGRAGIGVGAVAFDTTQITSKENRSNPQPDDPCHPLARGAHPPAIVMPAIASNLCVRRLTPRECERLQGFPDLYTDIRWRGKPAPDGPRYKALGNSMAVPVMAWIGRRIAIADTPLERR